ncbi:Matrixin [compost metagenome]
MWKWLGAVTLILSVMTLQACAPKSQDDCGFVQNVYGERVSWKGEIPIKLYIHESVPEEFVPALTAAAKTWEDKIGHKLFEIDTKTRVKGALAPARDGQNVIYWMNSWEENKASQQARTSVYSVGDQIKEADMRVNDADYNFYWQASAAKGINIEAIFLHELGHVLGLKHKDGEGSVMATYLEAETDRTALASTDSASLQCEY